MNAFFMPVMLAPGEYGFACQMGMLRGKLMATGDTMPGPAVD